jgi:hypothetical protein
LLACCRKKDRSCSAKFLRLTAEQDFARPGTGGQAVLTWNNGILEFWNDGIRKEHSQKGFDQFSRNIPAFQSVSFIDFQFSQMNTSNLN